MTVRGRTLFLLIAAALASAGSSLAQDSDKPREFAEFRGTWTLDEKATDGLRQLTDRTGQARVFDPLGFPVARTIVIATTPTEMTVTKDSELPEVYRFDGTEGQIRDPRTKAPLIHRYSFTLVAGMLALTVRRPQERWTETLTDAYSMPGWDVLRVERQLSYVSNEGYLRTLSGIRNTPQVLTYRRVSEPSRR